MFYLIFGSFGGALSFLLYQVWFWLKYARWEAMPICKVLAKSCWLDSSGYRGLDIIIDSFAHIHISFYLILLGFVFIALAKDN